MKPGEKMKNKLHAKMNEIADKGVQLKYQMTQEWVDSNCGYCYTDHCGKIVEQVKRLSEWIDAILFYIRKQGRCI